VACGSVCFAISKDHQIRLTALKVCSTVIAVSISV
jgi:hypothetical protein